MNKLREIGASTAMHRSQGAYILICHRRVRACPEILSAPLALSRHASETSHAVSATRSTCGSSCSCSYDPVCSRYRVESSFNTRFVAPAAAAAADEDDNTKQYIVEKGRREGYSSRQ